MENFCFKKQKACIKYSSIVWCPSYCPAPFFVLDEVDAALDNSNIGKVSEQNRVFLHGRNSILTLCSCTVISVRSMAHRSHFGSR